MSLQVEDLAHAIPHPCTFRFKLQIQQSISLQLCNQFKQEAQNMGHATYVTLGVSASLVVDMSTLARIRQILSKIRTERLQDEVYIGEHREERHELSVYDYHDFKSWLEPSGSKGLDEAADFDMDAFNDAFGNEPRIIFMHCVNNFCGYNMMRMTNPHIYDEDDEDVATTITKLAKGQALLEHLGFDRKEIKLGYTILHS